MEPRQKLLDDMPTTKSGNSFNRLTTLKRVKQVNQKLRDNLNNTNLRVETEPCLLEHGNTVDFTRTKTTKVSPSHFKSGQIKRGMNLEGNESPKECSLPSINSGGISLDRSKLKSVAGESELPNQRGVLKRKSIFDTRADVKRRYERSVPRRDLSQSPS